MFITCFRWQQPLKRSLFYFSFFFFYFLERKISLIQEMYSISVRFFQSLLLLAIGFSVNNLGAIVRYRSIIIPLVVIIMAAQTDWKAITDLFSGKYKKKSATAI